ncbi:E3 ubiquitin-protein ligase TTC3 isoform X2 [Nematostella vectensis]|uniref:E3 ubiquitin-protein ligase TTC3 isoform X2 n=1 Tax=Nematostella vectensis TaxID=45351 RepID=UPI0020770F3A|nr:E3 ubiquitin-protein ligase TTC3 isoform X2 [Nematostella vectensis]
MPSSPRKNLRRKKAVSHELKPIPKPPKHNANVTDSEDESDLPALVDDVSFDESEKDEFGREKELERKATTNGESVEIWLDMSKAARERHMRVMKIYLLSPFLFGVVEQEDKWINWAYQSRLLPSSSKFEMSALSEEYFQAVDIVEDSFDMLNKHLLAKEVMEEMVKAMSMMDKINTMNKVEKAITCAESYNLFIKIRDCVKHPNNKRKDVGLLLAIQQACDHIKKLTRENKDLAKIYEENCLKGERASEDRKLQGNDHFNHGKYKAAISAYTLAISGAPYNHILYGNRAQSYLKSEDLREGLTDGRRAVVLKPDWTKGQFRYAQAFFELGYYERAISTNRAAIKLCSGCKNSKDLDVQYEKFMAKQEKVRLGGSVNGTMSSPHTTVNGLNGRQDIDKNNLDDLPALVDAATSDSSGDSSDSDDNHDLDGINSVLTDDDDGPPELVTESSAASDSDEIDARLKKNNTEAHSNHSIKKPKPTSDGHRNNNTLNIKDVKPASQGKPSKKREKKKDDPAQQAAAQRKKELMATLKQGTSALLDKKPQAAVRYYSGALKLLSEDPIENFEIKHIDYMLMLYAHGTACLATGIYKELLEATRQFETIIVQFKDTKFPLAFYGLGRVYHRQNRFSEALEPLNQGLEMVKGGEEFGVYRWPSSQVIIEETKPGKLLVAFQAFITVCSHPPRPDAVCRYNYCSGRTVIYLSDPDYKGYVRLMCEDSCRIDYHHNCWKKFKSSYDEKNGDKDFLDGQCMTPDCEAPVVRVQIFSDAGLKTEFASSKADTKAIKQSKTKTPSKQHKQDRYRRERAESKTEENNLTTDDEKQKDEHLSIQATPKSQPSTQQTHLNDHSSDKTKQLKQDTKIQTDENQLNACNLEDNGTGLYILKKNEEKPQEDPVTGKGIKSKSKRKKAKNTQSLDEFLKHLGSDGNMPSPTDTSVNDVNKPETLFGGRLFPTPPPDWYQQELDSSFAIPPELQSEHQAIEAEFKAMNNPFPLNIATNAGYVADPIKADTETALDYILSMFHEVLSVHGPLDISDARILEPLNFLPESYQQTIDNAGGLKPFFTNSGQFLVTGNTVMLPDDLAFQELIQKQNPALGLDGIRKSKSFTNDEANFLLDDHQGGHLSNSASPETSPLNPSSKEFYPRSLSLTNLDDGTTTLQPPCLPTDVTSAENINMNIKIPLLHDDSIVEWLVPNMADKISKTEDNNIVSNCVDTGTETVSNCTIDASFSPEKSAKDSSSDSLLSPPRLSRFGSNGPEVTISVKTKGIQTQPQVKTKGIGTDPLTEPYKSEYTKAVQERDEANRKAQELQDKLAGIQGKHNLEVEKLKEKLSEMQQEKEKLAKEISSSKHECKQELHKLRGEFEDKKRQSETLQDRFKTESERFKATIKGLQDELTAAKADLSTEKTKSSSDTVQKDEAVRKVSALRQQQEQRAQEAEVKLLELRRDVGLRFLERAYQESHITLTNLTAYSTMCPGTSKLEEMLNTWRVYVNDTRQKIVQCKTIFDKQIQEVQSGRALSTLTPLPIPGPAPYPAPTMLNLPGQQGIPPQVPQTSNRLPPTATTTALSVTQPPKVAQAAGTAVPASKPATNNMQAAKPSPANHVAPPKASSTNHVAAAKQGVFPAAKQPMQFAAPVAKPPPPQATAPQAKAPIPAKPTADDPCVAGGVTAAKAVGGASETKTRPSNSFEKIMLRLSTMYPHFSRSELTGFIKEVRQNKHGTLTGLSLEEIVASVAGLVDAKHKSGALRPPGAPVAQAGPHRITAPPRQLNQSANSSQPPAPVPAHPPPAASLEFDEEDPCVICHEEMRHNVVRLECGHRYHDACIRKWLLGEQSTCPTCRVHALLPDEFPRLR